MKTISIMQCMRPYGSRVEQFGEVPDHLFEKYKDVKNSGCIITMECVPPGLVSICIEDPIYGDFDCRLPDNGPEVSSALNDMLLEFDPARLAQWKSEIDLANAEDVEIDLEDLH